MLNKEIGESFPDQPRPHKYTLLKDMKVSNLIKYKRTSIPLVSPHPMTMYRSFSKPTFLPLKFPPVPSYQLKDHHVNRQKSQVDLIKKYPPIMPNYINVSIEQTITTEGSPVKIRHVESMSPKTFDMSTNNYFLNTMKTVNTENSLLKYQ